MKITRIKKSLNKQDIIYLGSNSGDFPETQLNTEEKSYLKKQFHEEKTRVHINRFSSNLFYQLAQPEKKKSEAEDLEWLRKEASRYNSYFEEYKISNIQISATNVNSSQILAFIEGIALSHYQFLKYFADKDKKQYSLKSIQVQSDNFSENDLLKIQGIVHAVCKARDLVNEPLSYLTAEQLSVEMAEMAREAGFSIETLNKKKIESLKMGGLLAVNKGSIDPPTFNILEYKPENAKNKKPYVLVGKGVVYDTGGLSLKPTANSMDYMKSDMAGAAVVAATIYALAKTSLAVHVIGLIPATDNRPDGNAYVPGDVVKMYDGTTVEVLNTDAEGRMIMADALSWAKQYEPELVIDVATLTGAAWVAIGTQGLVGMGNADKKIMEELKSAGMDTYERIAEFPFWDEYGEMMKSDIADLKNIGGRLAGAITAGKFLEHFTDYPYIHLDIAGPSFLKSQDAYRSKGGSGIGVRLLHRFFEKIIS